MKEKIDEGLKGFETVQVSFRSHKAAQQFRDDMKAKFNYPETKSRYQVIHGRDEEGNTVIVESTLFNRIISEKEENNMSTLFESIVLLQEGSKKRFIDRVWNNPDFDEPHVFLGMRDYDLSNVGLLNNGLPNAEDITKWVDSGAADKFLKSLNFNWQNFTFDAKGPDGKTPLYIYLIDEYLKYMKKGGSIKNRQQMLKLNPKEVFKSNKMLIAEEEGADTSDCDFVFLNSLENDKFIFVVPMNWEACRFIDSFECGGQGAKWCIGYEQNDDYFNDYIKNGNLFICAYSKKKDAPKNELKYMIQLCPDYPNETQAWRQSDEPDETISIAKFNRYFGHTANEFVAAMQQHVLIDDNVYNRHGLNNWFGDEGPSGIDEEYWYYEDFLEDHTYYYSEFLNYTKDDLHRLYDGDEVIVDCEGMNVSGAKLKASSSDDLDIPTFVNFLKDNGINTNYLHFMNGKFKRVIWEPEACGGFEGCPEVYFKRCKIDELYFNDLSGLHADTIQINIRDDCELNNLHWGVPEEEFEDGIINYKSLCLYRGVKPKKVTYELNELEENKFIMRNRLLESFLHVKEDFDGSSSEYDELKAVLDDIMDMDIGGSVNDLVVELFSAIREGHSDDIIKDLANELANTLDDAGFEGEATDVWDAIAYIGL